MPAVVVGKVPTMPSGDPKRPEIPREVADFT